MSEGHLYQVDVWHTCGDDRDGLALFGTLNVLVAQESIDAALTTAQQFLSQNRDKFPDAVIRGIRYHGTIDAVGEVGR